MTTTGRKKLKLSLDVIISDETKHKVTFLPFEHPVKLINFEEVASLPVTRSTCVDFNGHLLAVGGFSRESGNACSEIFLLDEKMNEWLIVGRMPTAHYNCLVEVVEDKLVVIGGWLHQHAKCDIEVCTIKSHA